MEIEGLQTKFGKVVARVAKDPIRLQALETSGRLRKGVLQV